MKLDKKLMTLYAVTDRTWLKNKPLHLAVEEAILGGATFVQLREKNVDNFKIIEEGKKIKEITNKHKIPFVINDSIELALAIDADGVHLGQDDITEKNCRNLIGENKILGITAHNVEEAIKAEKLGADYIGVGAAFPTTTKDVSYSVTVEDLQNIRKAVSIPIVAIGGINENNVLKLKGSNIDGVAVVSAIFAKENITKSTKELLTLVKEMLT